MRTSEDEKRRPAVYDSSARLSQNLWTPNRTSARCLVLSRCAVPRKLSSLPHLGSADAALIGRVRSVRPIDPPQISVFTEAVTEAESGGFRRSGHERGRCHA